MKFNLGDRVRCGSRIGTVVVIEHCKQYYPDYLLAIEFEPDSCWYISCRHPDSGHPTCLSIGEVDVCQQLQFKFIWTMAHNMGLV